MISVKVPAEFQHPATIHRFASGAYIDGSWIDGSVEDIAIQAAIQPLTAGDYRLLPEGNTGQRGWKVFWNGDFQMGNDGELRPDEMTFQGKRFKLVHKEEWIDNGYSAATFIEIKL